MGVQATSKILVLASYAPSLVLFRLPLMRELQARGHKVVAAGPPCDETQARLLKLGVAYVPIESHRTSTNPLVDAAYFVRIVRVLRHARPTAIVSYTAKPVVYGSLAAAVSGVKRRVAIVTGVGSVLMDKRSRLAKLLRWLYRIALSQCHRVAFQNPDDQDDFVLQGLVGREKAFRVSGSGVPLDFFEPSELPDRPVFLLIARLLADKGIREYAAAARELKGRYPEAIFRLAGWFDDNPSGLTRQEVESWVQGGYIEYLGRLDDVRPAIAASRVYVLPSYREGTPRTVLEAMAMGRAVVTTDAPGCRETVRNGWNGLLVPPHDAKALADAMEECILQPRMVEEMGGRSRELAVSAFDAIRVAKDLADGFEL